MAQKDMVNIAKSDLLSAWTVLENLAVSLDQIGSMYSEEKTTENGTTNHPGLPEALVAYLTPELVKAINTARIRLGHYIPDAEAESLSECIPYWNSTLMTKDSGEAA
jgi:hypothetical protein